jgi:hypothetical protein
MFSIRDALPNTADTQAVVGVAVSRSTGEQHSSPVGVTREQYSAVFYEMLTCERCGASYPACGWCPFCNPRGRRR